MRKIGIIFSFLFVMLGTLLYSANIQLNAAPETAVQTTPTDPIYPGLGMITSRTARDGRIATSNQAILGPDSCTHLGDPY